MPYVAPVELAIFEGPADRRPSRVDVEIFRTMLDAVTAVNVIHLRANPRIPRLFDAITSGLVTYVDPRDAGRDDPWSDVLIALRRRRIDCDRMACWLAAEMMVRDGMPARVGFTIEPNPADPRRWYIHAFVRVGSKTYDPTLLARRIQNVR